MGHIKYYAVGEYGGQTGRPHYHAIIFNIHSDLLHKRYKHQGKTSKIWSHGNIDIQPISTDTIHYVAGYVIKRDIDKSRDYKRQIEFAIMSKGLGLNYVDNNRNYHIENETILTKFNGTDMPIPTYYRDKIFTPEQKEQLSYEAVAAMEKKHDKDIKKLIQKGHTDPETELRNRGYAAARSRQQKVKKDPF